MLQRRRARVQVGVTGKETALSRRQRRSHSVSAPRFSAIKLDQTGIPWRQRLNFTVPSCMCVNACACASAFANTNSQWCAYAQLTRMCTKQTIPNGKPKSLTECIRNAVWIVRAAKYSCRCSSTVNEKKGKQVRRKMGALEGKQNLSIGKQAQTQARRCKCSIHFQYPIAWSSKDLSKW